ncbi:MAG: aldolase/citrate lyase family protein [Candidatus Tectimicrobiota bacterium]
MSEQVSLKQRIRRGDIIVGVSVPMHIERGRLEDILSRDTYSFVSVDSQHSAYNEELLVSFCAMAAAVGIPVQFRIKHTRHAYLIGNILDLGPLSIEVPLVETEAIVDEALAAFYYPQVGKRSWGGNARYGIQGRDNRLEYAAWWNSQGILCLQMETLAAVTQARQLAKPGVDCLTWGPADLSFDLEAHPEHPFKSVDDCLRHVLKQLAGTDIRVSFRTYSHELRNKYLDMGVTVFMERPKP